MRQGTDVNFNSRLRVLTMISVVSLAGSASSQSFEATDQNFLIDQGSRSLSYATDTVYFSDILSYAPIGPGTTITTPYTVLPGVTPTLENLYSTGSASYNASSQVLSVTSNSQVNYGEVEVNYVAPETSSFSNSFIVGGESGSGKTLELRTGNIGIPLLTWEMISFRRASLFQVIGPPSDRLLATSISSVITRRTT
jgi:hypothetical protein